MIKPKTIFVMAFCAFMFAALCYLLAFGGAVFCCAPARPGKGFWQPEKFFYGLLPMFASIEAFAFTFQLWARAFIRQRNAWLVWGVVAIFAVVLDFSLFLKYRGRQDERIKLVWKGESGAFSWGSGEVKLPAGFTYKANYGIDTFVGQFTSQDGNLVIEHDIGELAGEHGGMGKSETLTEGSRVRVGRAIRHDDNGRTTFFSKVSFPDSGCANFYVESHNENDAAAIEFIARSFRPTGWTPSWARPLLPEVLRSDCRYRLSLPSGF
jgi:hypothetical protein